jgi:UDP-glucose 4-epimerase
LGDGTQSKSYVYIDDIVNAVLLAATRAPRPFSVFNVATGDYITVTEIAEIALEVLDLSGDATKLIYSGGDRGWKGDVPIVRLNTDKIRSLGWSNARSTRDAIRDSLRSMLTDAKAGHFT